MTLLDEAPVARVPKLVEFVDRPTPIYVMGDSHCLMYSDLLFDEPNYFRQKFITRAKYIPGFQAATFTDANGNLNPQIAQIMIGENLLEQMPTGGFQAFHRADTEHAKSAAIARGVGRYSPVMIFFAGDIDLRGVFIKQLASPLSDFVLPDEPFDASRFPEYEAQNVIPTQLVVDLAMRMLSPLFAGMGFLLRFGFENLYLHTLAPPMLDDVENERMHGYYAPVALRYKATMLFNNLFRRFCAQSGVRLLDMWDTTTMEGRLDPQFQLDNIHLNRKAAALSVDKVVDDMLHRRPSAVDPFWQRAHNEAAASYAKRPGRDLTTEAQFSAAPITTIDLGRDFAESIAAQLDFALDMGSKHPRLDWCGNAIKAFTDYMMCAKPSREVLDQVYERLFAPDVERTIAACMGSDFTVFARMFESLPQPPDAPQIPGPHTYHHDGHPPGVLRGVLYLVDVDEGNGPFEYIDASGVLHTMTAPAGSLLLFNANHYLHRAVPPKLRRRANLDFVFAPLVPGDRRRVMWAGMNNWPTDPFIYSTRDFVISFGPPRA